jgi:HEPN domain-containing protein
MKNNEREATRWYDQALDDAKFVEWVHKENRFFDKGCFIAQQAGEKALKACLYASGQRRVIGHSLFEMASKLMAETKDFEKVIDKCKQLDRFYIPTRYPNGLPGGSPFQVYSSSELEDAIEALRPVIEIAEEYLVLKGIRIR